MKRLLLYTTLLLWTHCCLAQITYETVFIDYDSAWEYREMKIIPVRTKGLPSSMQEMMTLRQAMRSGLVEISERGTASTENVHWVRVRNKSNKPLYVASGEIITGGRQDRMLSKDTVLIPNGADQYLPAMCVEENRWSDKERKFQYHGYSNPSLRKVMNNSGNQVLIWKEVYAQLDSSDIRSQTLAYGALRADKKALLDHSDYMNCFMQNLRKDDSTIVGVICISGDKILGTDVYASNNLFRDEFESILSGYVEESMRIGTVPRVTNDEVAAAMEPVLRNELSQEEYCKKNGKLFRYKGKVFHVNAFF